MIGRSALLELAKGFGLVTPDPFSLCELGGVQAWDYRYLFIVAVSALEWETENTGYKTQGLVNQGTEDQGLKDPESWGLCCAAAASYSKDTTTQFLPMLQAQTHGCIFYIVFMYTQGIACNKQWYFKLSSDYLLLRVVYC